MTEAIKPSDHAVLDEGVQAHRIARLEDLIEASCYSRASILCKITKINPSLVSQYRAGLRPITERTVAMIEKAFNQLGWFEAEHNSAQAQALPTAPMVLPNSTMHSHALAVETFGPVCDDRSVLLPEDAGIFVAQISAAATKVRRAASEREPAT